LTSFALPLTRPSPNLCIVRGICPLLTSQFQWLVVSKQLVAVTTGSETSRDKVVNFPCVLPDLLVGVYVEFWLFQIQCSVALAKSALYQTSARQYIKFTDGFLQLQGHSLQPCLSLMFPINLAHTGTCTLLVYKQTQRTKTKKGG